MQYNDFTATPQTQAFPRVYILVLSVFMSILMYVAQKFLFYTRIVIKYCFSFMVI